MVVMDIALAMVIDMVFSVGMRVSLVLILLLVGVTLRAFTIRMGTSTYILTRTVVP